MFGDTLGHLRLPLVQIERAPWAIYWSESSPANDSVVPYIIRDEKKNTFEWLFETWLKVMGGKHPKAIITDQDPSMKAEIERVFPN